MHALEIAARLTATFALTLSGLFLSWRLLWALLGSPGGGPRLLRYILWIAAFYFVASVSFHLLYPLGAFTPITAPLFGTTACVFVALQPGVRSNLWLEVTSGLRWLKILGERYPLGWRWVVLATIALLTVRTLLIPPLGWDSLTYHNVRIAFWLQGEGFSYPDAPGTWNLFRHYFAGHEVLAAWTVMPMRNDLFAGMINAIDWIWLGLSLWACARELKLPEPLANAAGWLWMTPACVIALMGSGYVEIALCASALCALAGTLHFLSHPDRWGVAVLAAMSAGIAAATKLPGLLPAAICGLGIAYIAFFQRSGSPKQAFITVLLALFAVLAPVAPFLIFNTIETGAALSPAPIKIGGVRLGVADPAMKWFQMRGLDSSRYKFANEWNAIVKGLGTLGKPSASVHQLGVSWSLLAPIGILLLFLRSWKAAILVFAIVAGNIAFYFLPGMTVARLLWPSEFSRYLLQALTLGTVLSLMAIPARHTEIRKIVMAFIAACAIFGCLRMTTYGIADFEWLYLSYLFIGIALLSVIVWQLLVRRLFAIASVLVFGSFIFGGLTLVKVRKDIRQAVYNESFQFFPCLRYWAPAMKFTDDGKKHVIAITSGEFQNLDNWWSYPFFGNDFQNKLTYIPISKSGKILHFGYGKRRSERASRVAWKRRLLKQGVTEVVTFHPASVEQEWMQLEPKVFRQVTSNPYWGMFRINLKRLARSLRDEDGTIPYTPGSIPYGPSTPDQDFGAFGFGSTVTPKTKVKPIPGLR